MKEWLEIPYQQLSKEALLGVIEAFVLREGTDYGQGEWSLCDKVMQIRGQLESGKAKIVFDPQRETNSIIQLEHVP